MRTVCIALFCLVVLTPAIQAAELTSLAETRTVADAAVDLFRQEKIDEGYASLKPYWPLPPVEIDNLASQTRTQWPMVQQRFGASLATEFITEQRAGSSLVRYIYLQKFQHHAIRWIFTFYKPRDRWVINSLSFDDSIKELFRQ